MGRREELLKMYELLNGYFGDLHWWPADDPFEVMVGAILTQNTAWTNVEKAIQALRRSRLLTPAALFSIPEDELARIIRPSGYYHLKAARLKTFVRFMMMEYSGNVESMKVADLSRLRDKLLGVKGIGPETADSILLYACQKPVFISDAYTRRILLRHGMIGNDADYHSSQALFMDHLQPDVDLFNRYHALLVNTGKTFCRRTAECAACPLAILQAV
ncbi:MAG: endonuclease III domain-containing protein [Deltaproteobacteria bacterium]|nr:endonuclease III domain-containing protein [Deltaproteobacteria bacterium]